MLKLLKFLKYYKKETVLGPLLKLAEALLELFVPLVISALIDVGINGEAGQGYIIKMCLILVAFGAFGLAFSVTAQFFAAKAAVGFTRRIREKLFAHIQRLGYPELDALGTSTMVTRLTSDMNQIQNGVNLSLRLLLRSPFVVFGAMIMAFFVDVQLALIFVVVIPVLAIVVFSIMLASIPLYKKVQQKLDSVLASVRENLTGVRVVRAFCKEEDEQQNFNDKNRELVSKQVTVGRISALMNPLTYVIINLAIAYLIYSGAISVEAGVISQGALVALYNYMSQILVELIKLASLIITITRSFACGNRVQAVLEIEPSQKNGSNREFDFSADAVEFENVSLVYGTDREPSIENVTFSASAGQVIGIIGGTGSGKTSVVNLIPRFYDATSGTVKVFGKDVKDCDTDALRALIGVVPQKNELFKGTIRENLLWGNENATEQELERAILLAQAQDVVASKEGGLDSIIEQRGRNLSGGQRQRLTIARALVKNPKILILDDSASALDYATDARLRKAIKELDATVFVVSQRTSSIRNADKIIVLDDGAVLGQGTHEELLATCPIYSEIHFSQTKEERV
ncbi:MAG: ABC transporter ATP-binding protein [Clostridia bacterium]|nr:ABC transporter ATP-binding protein [Clostridia bacterium]